MINSIVQSLAMVVVLLLTPIWMISIGYGKLDSTCLVIGMIIIMAQCTIIDCKLDKKKEDGHS